MKRSHMIPCSAAAAFLGLAACQSAEEREAAVERDAFAQWVDEIDPARATIAAEQAAPAIP